MNPSIYTFSGTGTFSIPVQGGKKTKALVTNAGGSTFGLFGYLNPPRNPRDNTTLDRKPATVKAAGATDTTLLKDLEPGFVELSLVVTVDSGTDIVVEVHQSNTGA